MVQLKLRNNYVTLLDEESLPLVQNYDWVGKLYHNTVYAERKSEGRTIFLHRVIMRTPAHLEVDHIDGDGLNNQLTNLRNCTHQQNMQNKIKADLTTTSKYKGVSWHISRQKWRAKIGYCGKVYHIGYFNCEDFAAIAYNLYASHLFGEFAKLNSVSAESMKIFTELNSKQ